jgi:DNA topoisomerase-1
MTLTAAPEESAEEAGLRYVTDARPGISRVRRGRGFSYLRPDGSPVDDPRQLDWIRSLAIPPAWTDVWICPDRHGHLQATGRDSRGRKVYRYHPDWRPARDETKYERLVEFAAALPRIRARVDADLRKHGLPRDKVLAAVVRLLERTALRIGNPQYARDNGSFGLTTLRDRHARVEGGTIRLRFKGKSGNTVDAVVSDRRLATVVDRLQELPGQELFVYLGEDGEPRAIGSDDVNAYLKDTTGQNFSAKDFRTWAGTLAAAAALRDGSGPDLGATSRSAARHEIVAAMRRTAERLGNTAAVTRSAYVHPALIDAYLDGEVIGGLAASGNNGNRRPTARRGLSRDERSLLRMLRQAASKRRRALR